MCEFCTEHGEGKKWYLQMKNYSKELLVEELSASTQDAIGAAKRYEWTNRFWENFVIPAITGVPGLPPDKMFASTTVEGKKVEHFGQVLPVEDVEKVIDMVDSITRMPCGCRFLTTGKTDQRYCFGLALDKSGILGRFPDASSSLEVLDKEEAIPKIQSRDRETRESLKGRR